MRCFVKFRIWLNRPSQLKTFTLLVLVILLLYVHWRLKRPEFNRRFDCSILDDEDCGVSSDVSSVDEQNVVWCAEKGGDIIKKDSVRELGEAPQNKVYLTVGIPTVERKYQNKTESYLTATLDSLLTKLSPEDRQHVLFVVLLADTDKAARELVKRTLREKFGHYLDQNLIHVIAPPPSYYPQLQGLPRTMGDSQVRMNWRSKQTMDYVFLLHYCEGMSQYYMQLEDDVLVEANYMDDIRGLIERRTDEKWAYLQFCTFGFIGKVFRNEDLRNFGRYLRLFYNDIPCDWLLFYYNTLHGIAKDSGFYKGKELFVHIGHQSSSLGT